MLQIPLRRTRPTGQPDLDATTHISLVPELWKEAHYIAQRSTPQPPSGAGGGNEDHVPVLTSPAAQLLMLGAALLLCAFISGCFLPRLVPALFVLLAVPALIGAGLLAISATSSRHRELAP
ncbi:hypothetical protein HUN58_02075 [Curtobacterium sp. Csp1]|uniref:hypothetical protein n=1 Tax=Curtobacterium sp. Csp1 TaxID=2495429 RepID=UPI001597DC4B|nr:hypothetical protein [Curtobacterium sp. Csp1]QKS18848.1 hypothetical protein HUN58_02075 [Curtobacterium sp. Csp1]